MKKQTLEVLSGEAALSRLRSRVETVNSRGKHPAFAFYSTVLGAITFDPAFMTVPIDDHMATRGHAVFDTANVVNGVCYGLDFHIDRLLNSAKKARIDVSQAEWLGKTSVVAEQKARIKELILHTIAASGRRDGIYVRYWLSAARGDFAISPNDCVDRGSNLYIVVHATPPPAVPYAGLVEASVQIPLKNRQLATLKSNNYLINALCSMEAEEKCGVKGCLGLQLDETGNLAEFSIGSIGLVCEDGVLRTPKQDRILASTTVARVLELAREYLVPKGLLSGVEFADLRLEDALEAREVLELGGGDVQAVVKLNGSLIGKGKPGPVALALRELLAKERMGSYFTDRVPYERYASRL